ncbi:protein SOB FIVE-LIKE 2 [Alnus glutinosa]|uniref:protein SOB FIVE-LIKE 2 n=1 Tax=Alnus glutinosa TaxID=3517 RepID=UPI002D78631D|nr:protein SOB FIVE-LIKE 2 [Alnus glutinosa]
MESSQMFGAAEECHSSESGWTMYIGDDDDDDGGGGGDYGHSDDDGNDDDDDNDANHDDDSDDSMASDASSGPSHRSTGKGAHGSLAVSKRDEEENDIIDRCLDKKPNKPQKEMQRGQRIKKDKKESTVPVLMANAPAQSSGAKVRKDMWMGKTK